MEPWVSGPLPNLSRVVGSGTPTMCLEKGHVTWGHWPPWLSCQLCSQDSRAWGLGAGGKADRRSPASSVQSSLPHDKLKSGTSSLTGQERLWWEETHGNWFSLAGFHP